MSHTVTVKTDIKDMDAADKAAQVVGATFRQKDTVRLYQSNAVYEDCMSLELPGWNYKVAIMEDGQMHYDNYEGSWGSIDRLNEFRQEYAAQVVEKSAGMTWITKRTTLEDGSIRIELTQ